MFAKREPKQLRQRLFEIERDFKLGQLPKSKFNKLKVCVLRDYCFIYYVLFYICVFLIILQKEILSALRQLGEKLNEKELIYLNESSTLLRSDFEDVTEDSGWFFNEKADIIDFSCLSEHNLLNVFFYWMYIFLSCLVK